MYRVAHKTTKKTEFKCLKCHFCKIPENIDINSDAVKERGILVECMAENKCMLMPFNAKYFYCKEYKSANEMSEEEITKIVNENRMKDDIDQYKENLKYFSAKQKNELIKEYKKRMKEVYNV